MNFILKIFSESSGVPSFTRFIIGFVIIIYFLNYTYVTLLKGELQAISWEAMATFVGLIFLKVRAKKDEDKKCEETGAEKKDQNLYKGQEERP